MLLFLSAPPLPLQKPRRRSMNITCRREAPKVKSSFYKNPSKAIEKGGGFYIPGLRGPRLRVAVSALAGTLLTLNHVTATTTTPSLFRSEIMAMVATLAVLGTAAVDIAAERAEERAVVQAAIDAGSEPKSMSMESVPEQIGDEAALWAVQVARDLASVTAVAVCRDDEVIFGDGAAMGGKAGVAVGRVAQEGKALYIDDAQTLPPDVTFPFLPTTAWSVYLVPIAGSVICFCAAPKALGVTERRWLSQLARRFVQ